MEVERTPFRYDRGSEVRRLRGIVLVLLLAVFTLLVGLMQVSRQLDERESREPGTEIGAATLGTVGTGGGTTQGSFPTGTEREGRNDTGVVPYETEVRADMESAPTGTEQKRTDEGPRRTSLGVFRMTAYCPCERCCGVWAEQRTDGVVYTASGAVAQQGRTVAVDPEVIPYGTTVYINGQAYVAEDCGGAIKGSRIDVYFDSHAAAQAFGVQEAEIFVKGGGEER